LSDAKSSNELAQDRTDLALNLTLMAASRSLMAWIRTGLSMIGFGLTLDKFLSSDGQGLTARDPASVDLFLIMLGNLSLLFGSIEYWQTVSTLRRTYHCSKVITPQVRPIDGVSLLGRILQRSDHPETFWTIVF
jgi:putative membrane protein